MRSIVPKEETKWECESIKGHVLLSDGEESRHFL